MYMGSRRSGWGGYLLPPTWGILCTGGWEGVGFSLSTGKLTYRGIVAPRMGLQAVMMYVVIRVIFFCGNCAKKILPLCILFSR